MAGAIGILESLKVGLKTVYPDRMIIASMLSGFTRFWRQGVCWFYGHLIVTLQTIGCSDKSFNFAKNRKLSVSHYLAYTYAVM